MSINFPPIFLSYFYRVKYQQPAKKPYTEAVVAEIAGQLVTGTFILVRTGAGCPKDTYCNLTQQLWTFQGEPFTPRSGISEPIQPIQFLWM
ncbi:2310_t:CDS:2 [Funneliformis mosseae]|uniref:2310_t:CDS:1 n=1 Tax=Funneliformis mosseae TaxID=27381 RepID=A0A9N8VYS3_FUNMO|nr:2310_t:CDS:2 [Funneliformis mosseae]